MELAPLDRGVGAEGAADDFAQRLGAVDDEQPTDLRVEPALDQIVDQRLDDSGIFGRPLDQAERMLIAVAVDAEDGDQYQIVANMQAIALFSRFDWMRRSSGSPLIGKNLLDAFDAMIGEGSYAILTVGVDAQAASEVE